MLIPFHTEPVPICQWLLGKCKMMLGRQNTWQPFPPQLYVIILFFVDAPAIKRIAVLSRCCVPMCLENLHKMFVIREAAGALVVVLEVEVDPERGEVDIEPPAAGAMPPWGAIAP